MGLKNPVSGGNWIALSLASSYAPKGAGLALPAYRRDSLGIVHLRGTLGWIGGAVTTIASLPLGFRPPSRIIFIAYGWDINSTPSPLYMKIENSGNLDYVAGGAYLIGLDQISFATY